MSSLESLEKNPRIEKNTILIKTPYWKYPPFLKKQIMDHISVVGISPTSAFKSSINISFYAVFYTPFSHKLYYREVELSAYD
jgi:hypothetical protein